jgi:hypothetical protein
MRLRRWLVAVAWCSQACGSGATSQGALVIQGIDPPCPTPGGIITLTIGGGETQTCDAGHIYVGDLELMNLGVAQVSPLTLTARLPEGFVLPEGAEIRVVCGSASGSIHWYGVCSPGGGRPDAAQDAVSPDVASFCGQAIDAVIEAVDQNGRAFPRDADGVFLVPIDADDFAFDTGKSHNVSTHDVTYNFASDCYGTQVSVKAPVLGGFSARGFWLDKRCQFMVEIVDLGCPEGRVGRAQGSFKIVPAP